MADQAYHNLTPRAMIFAMFSARNIISKTSKPEGSSSPTSLR